MTSEQLTSWLDAYGNAWVQRDPALAGQLFSEDATYREKPFDEPMRGRKAIEEYWARAVGPHDDVHFGFDVLAVAANQGVAHWWVSFCRPPSRDKIELDGVFLLSFQADGRCAELREWWHRK